MPRRRAAAPGHVGVDDDDLVGLVGAHAHLGQLDDHLRGALPRRN
jgi:hypothetical protein